MDNILIGADPELFVWDPYLECFVSAHDIFEGTKDLPYPTDFGAIQVDGTAVEFNIKPCSTAIQFVERISAGLNYIKEILDGMGFEISYAPVANFDEDYFFSIPEEAKVLGCSPDYSGKTGLINPGPSLMFRPLRTSSGHVHIGWENCEDYLEPEAFTERLQVVRAVAPRLEASAALWEAPESDVRRLYYGGDWAFRPKPYGVEMRQLDALWLKDEEHMIDVFNTSVEAVQTYFSKDRKAAKAA